MARKLVVCCDGTWNVPAQKTNVYRTYDFLRERLGHPAEVADTKRGTVVCSGTSPKGDEVFLFYDQGIGTKPETRYVDGVLGGGLSKNVIDAYQFLAEHYVDGAEIYLFGFSRGAYTARSVAGFIAAAGLLKDARRGAIERAYFERYAIEGTLHARADAEQSLRDRIKGELSDLWHRVIDDAPRHDGVKIQFVGVYDTVGALGVPLSDDAIRKLNQPFVGFHDMRLGDLIEHAAHALAADERRKPYVPSLWVGPSGSKLRDGQTLLQVWFPGVHSDIGGGYPDRGIGDHTLAFMMGEAAKHGLVLDDGKQTPDVQLEDLPKQHDSIDAKWREIAKDLHLDPELEGPRPIGLKMRDPDGRELDVLGDVRVHWTLFERMGKEVEVIGDAGVSKLSYTGANLERTAGRPLVQTLERILAAAAAAAGAGRDATR